jgi:cytidine deaminase
VRPQQQDLELVGSAVRALRRGLGPELHPTATAVRTSGGHVHTSLGLGGGCPEPGAIGTALAAGERVSTLVTVRHVSADATRVVAPCRDCRALLLVHAPALRVIHLADGLQVAPVAELPQLVR